MSQTCNENCKKIDTTPEPIKNGKFFFFGCWNRRDAKLDNFCTDDIVAEIGNLNKKGDEVHDFGIILGDNIYPDKEKKKIYDGSELIGETKTKVFFKTKMTRGMEVLKNMGLNIPIHIVLGNHDVEDCDILNMQLVDTEGWNFQKNLYTKLYTHVPSNPTDLLDTTQTAKPIVTRLVLIDTNVIRDYSPKKTAHQTSDAYNILKKNIPSDTTSSSTSSSSSSTSSSSSSTSSSSASSSSESCIQDDSRFNTDPASYYEQFKHILLKKHNSNVDVVIIAGHEPLFSVKFKDADEGGGKRKMKESRMAFANDLLQHIKQLQCKTVYICADTHAYIDSNVDLIEISESAQEITSSIRQVIAGTGGAEPDIYQKDEIKLIMGKNPVTKETDKQILKFTPHCVVNSYGYGVFDISKFATEKSANSTCVSVFEKNKQDTRAIVYRANITERECVSAKKKGGYYELYKNNKKTYTSLNI
jgi:hypothetical protein